MSPGHVTSPIVLTTGELTISQNLKILGPGAAELTISGGGNSTVFNVASSVNATLSGLTVTGGNNAGAGGGLVNNGDLKLTDDVFSDNSGQTGGAIDAASGSLSRPRRASRRRRVPGDREPDDPRPDVRPAPRPGPCPAHCYSVSCTGSTT